MTTSSKAQEERFDPDERVVYKRVGDVHLSMDIFKPKGQGRSDSPVAGIVFFHGGAWNDAHPSQFHPHCHYLASRGMLAMSAAYRVKNVHGTTPYECVTDGKSAVRWLRKHAPDLGVDPKRIAAGGGSAGGHVAAAAATVTAFEPDGEDHSISSKPDALVLFNPIVDNGPDGAGYGRHDRVADRWQEVSPMHNMATGAPPAILFLGTEDVLVSVSTVEEFKRRMNDVGSRCDLWTYDGQPHAFFNYHDGDNPYYDATVYEADKFLASLGYLEGRPTVQAQAVEALLR